MDFPKDCPIKGSPMEPVTSREWQLLVKAIDELRDMVAEKLDSLHADMSGERVKVATLQEQYKKITQEVEVIKESKRWNWERVVLPVLLVLIAFLLPHLAWVK